MSLINSEPLQVTHMTAYVHDSHGNEIALTVEDDRGNSGEILAKISKVDGLHSPIVWDFGLASACYRLLQDMRQTLIRRVDTINNIDEELK